MDKRRQIILYVIALVSSLLAVLMVYSYVDGKVRAIKAEAASSAKVEVKTITVVEKPEVKSIVVAARDVYRGEAIEAEDITMLNVPTDGITVQGLFDDPQLVVGRVLNQDVYAGEWLLDRKLADPGREAAYGLSNMLENGERAVRIPIDRVSGLGGVLKPNDYVDVISVFRSADGKRRISRTILENIEVLMVGNQLGTRIVGGDGDEANANLAPDVTLRLSQRQAEYIVLAQDVGKLRLVLRNPADTKVEDSNGVNVQAMEISDSQRASRSRAVPREERQTIQILQGGKIQEVPGR